MLEKFFPTPNSKFSVQSGQNRTYHVLLASQNSPCTQCIGAKPYPHGLSTLTHFLGQYLIRMIDENRVQMVDTKLH